MPKNKIYKDTFKFKCPTPKCEGRLHPTLTLDSTLEFRCYTCGNYTTMSYDKANLIVSKTGKPPKQFRD